MQKYLLKFQDVAEMIGGIVVFYNLEHFCIINSKTEIFYYNHANSINAPI
jgi:hypothetical protein